MKVDKFYLAHLNRTIRDGGVLARNADGDLVVTDRYGVPQRLTDGVVARLDRDARLIVGRYVDRPAVPSQMARRQSRR